MSDRGWVSLHRKLIYSNVFRNEKTLKIWIYCLLEATHEPYQQLVGKQLVNLNVGEFVFGRVKASQILNMNESTVWRNMKLLEKMESISIKSNNKFSVIRVINFDDYQNKVKSKYEANAKQMRSKNEQQMNSWEQVTDCDTEEPKFKSEQQMNNKRTTNEQQMNTNNNTNNTNNTNNINLRSTQINSIVDEWNKLDQNIPKIKNINSGTKRYQLLTARINQYGIDEVINAIRSIQDSAFLKGYKTDFKITFDWFIKPNNFVKVRDGNYIDNTISRIKSSSNISGQDEYMKMIGEQGLI